MKRFRRDEALEEFWPAYADILMVVCLILILLVFTFVVTRPTNEIKEEQERRKALFKAQFEQVMKPEMGRQLLQLTSPPGETQTITFSDQLLFEVGDADLRKPAGRASLGKLTQLLTRALKRREGPLFETIKVNGHTDEVPIKTPQYPSNWHLSSARATSVVYFFVEGKIPPPVLSATGYAEFRAVDAATGKRITDRARKRRIEVELRYPDTFIAAWLKKQK